MSSLAAGITTIIALSGCSRPEAAGDGEALAIARQAIGASGVPLVIASIPWDPDPVGGDGSATLYTFGASRWLSTGINAGDAVALGDINNDGLDEVVIGYAPGPLADPTATGGIAIYNQFGRSITNFLTSSHSFGKGDAIALGDVNNDGFDEIVIGHAPPPLATPGAFGSVEIIARPGTVLGPFFTSGTPDFQQGDDVAVGDLNGDSFEEVIVGTANRTPTIPDPGGVAIFAHPSATFGAYPIGGVGFRQGSHLASADLNGDGVDELVIGHAAEVGDLTGGSIHVITDPSRTVAPLVGASSSFLQGFRIAAGDLDGDTWAEVIVGNASQTTSSSDNGSVSIYNVSGSSLSGFFGSSFPTFQKGSALGAGKRTSNSDLDSDEDGLPDVWETRGIDFDLDGVVDLDLPAMGAQPLHKDIFVEIDAFACSVSGGDCAAGDVHSHMPTSTELDPVVQAFLHAPVTNPDGVTGINLHVELDELLTHQQECDLRGGCFDTVKAQHFGTVAERSAANAAAIRGARSAVFHYNLWTHNQSNGSSGIGEYPGNDFIVSLGNWSGSVGTALDRAGTFMHELGHNLRLHHGGSDAINNKPNYLSVMSYAFQTVGIPPAATIDYSSVALPNLNETALDESVGIGTTSLWTYYWCPNGNRQDAPGSAAVNWNCNGSSSENPISADINNDRQCVAPGNDSVLSSAAGGDDVVMGGEIQAGPNGKLDCLIVAGGVRGDDIVSASTIVAGPNKTLETSAANDDTTVSRIAEGPNGQVDSTPSGDDIVVRNILGGADGILQTPPSGDDVAFGGRILPGANGTLDTVTLQQDDVSIVIEILPGPNLALDSTRTGDDLLLGYLITAGVDGMLDSDLISAGRQGDDVVQGTALHPGQDGIMQTIPVRDDQLLFQVINDGPNRTCETAAGAGDSLVRSPGSVEPAQLNGAEDWNRLFYQFRGTADYADGVHSTAEPETLTFQEVEVMRTRALLADVLLTGTTTATSVLPDTPFTYQFVATNSGPNDALLPTLNDAALPGLRFKACSASSGGLCIGSPTFEAVTYERLASGLSVTIDLSAEVDCSVAPGTVLANVASLETMTTDPNRDDNVVQIPITVEATTPVFETIHDVSVGACNLTSSGETLELSVPQAKDPCGRLVTVTGEVIASNSIPVPRTITGGHVTLPIGAHTVRWVASNGYKNVTSTQLVVVHPGAFANGGFDLRDRAHVTLASGAASSLANAGSAITQLGVEAYSGKILSVAPVDLRDRATVVGDIVSSRAITRGQQTTVTGLVRPYRSVALPPFPTLAGIVFPPSTGPDIVVNPDAALALPTGSYPNTIVNSGATLQLSSGDYYFAGLTINSASAVRVLDSAGPVRVFVAESLNFRGVFSHNDGSPARVLLAFNGTGTMVVEAPFHGTLLAPRGTAELGAGSTRRFEGIFAAKNLVVRPDVALVCVSSSQVSF